jgi:hypothetical protein
MKEKPPDLAGDLVSHLARPVTLEMNVVPWIMICCAAVKAIQLVEYLN